LSRQMPAAFSANWLEGWLSGVLMPTSGGTGPDVEAKSPALGDGSSKSGTRSSLRTPAQRVALAVVLLIALMTRVGWVLHMRNTDPVATTSHDTQSYVEPARAIAEDGAFAVRPGSRDPMYVRTPGYPALMAAVFAVDESETHFLLVQALLSCLTILLAYVIAARMWGVTVGIVAAALIVLEPLQFAASGTLLTESVFSLALLGVVAIGFHVFGGRPLRLRWCVLLGAAVAVATLIRPTTYYLPVFVVVLMILSARRWGLRRTLAGVSVFLLPVVMLIGGWQLRNDREVGSSRYSGIEAINIYADRGAYVLARHDGISVGDAYRKLRRQLSASPLAKCSPAGCSPAQPSRPGPYYDELLSRGITILTSYPIVTVEESVKGLAREAFGPGGETVGRYLGVRDSTPLKVILEAGLLCFYAAFAYGLFLVTRWPSGRGMGHLFALGTAAYVLLVSTISAANARFRGPVMPILALYAALGAVTACKAIRGALQTRSAHRA
jgi:4-amino-4-deoxy-L-arabinose transferase-like glycosyltransferase